MTRLFSTLYARLFRSVTTRELAARELAEAEVALLNAQTGREYATAICGYNEARIRRLKAFLASDGSERTVVRSVRSKVADYEEKMKTCDQCRFWETMEKTS